VSALTLIPGSSRLFTLRSAPPLPAHLERDQKLALEVQFSAESLGPFEGTLSIESNDPNHRFLEVPISATERAAPRAVLSTTRPRPASATSARS
jgi:hypothetical protein